MSENIKMYLLLILVVVLVTITKTKHNKRSTGRRHEAKRASASIMAYFVYLLIGTPQTRPDEDNNQARK